MKRKKDMRLSSFSADVKNMLDNMTTSEGKIGALKQLVKRIESEEKYNKNPEWRNSLLAKVYEHMAGVYYSIGDEKGVIEACTQIIKYNPSDGMSYYNRGSIYNNLEKYDKALKDFDDAILIMPNYASAYNNRGLVLDKLKRHDEAISDFDYAIGLEPSSITYYNRANSYFEQEKYKEAKQDYQKSLESGINDEELKRYITTAIDLIDKKLLGDTSV